MRGQAWAHVSELHLKIVLKKVFAKTLRRRRCLTAIRALFPERHGTSD